MKWVSLCHCKHTAVRIYLHEFYELHGEQAHSLTLYSVCWWMHGANAPFFKLHIPLNSSTQLTGLHNVRSVHIRDIKQNRVWYL